MRIRRLICYFLTLCLAFAAFLSNAVTAKAFTTDDLKNDSQMQLGYSIINGYSKLSERKGLNSYQKTAVYCGQDLSNPYIIALAGSFYLTHGVNLERTMTDNDYALDLICSLDGYLKAFGVNNERAASVKAALQKDGVPVLAGLDYVGLFFIKTDSDFANRLMQDDRVDFVFAGGQVPPSMKDLNMDGKSDKSDAPLIQSYLTGELQYPDHDENEYIKFAGDINGDKKLDIRDATALYRA